MIASERFSNKLQELFGGNYLIIPFATLNTQYTTAEQVVDGFGNTKYVQEYTNEYSELRKNNIIGVVNLQNPTRANASIYYVTSNYTVDFSVPTNVIKLNSNGEVIETPKFNFFDDCENITNSIINTTIDFGDNVLGKMTMAEPTYQGLEKDGEVEYAIYRLSGTFSMSNSANFGGDYKVSILVGNEFVELDGVNSYVEMLNNGMNAISVENTTKIKQNLSQLAWVCTISIDDLETENPARKKLYDIIHENIEFITPEAGEVQLKRKLRVNIQHGTKTRSIWAIVSITFRTTKNGIGAYDISFTDSNEKGAKLTFDTNGGSEVSVKEIMPFNQIGELPIPTKSGYLFNGWQIDGENISSSTIYSYYENKTAVAQWSTDLTGTKWFINETLPYPSSSEFDNDGFDINFKSNDKQFTRLGFLGLGANAYVYTPGLLASILVYSTNTNEWSDEAYRHIEITGGDEVSKQKLVLWLQKYAVQEE